MKSKTVLFGLPNALKIFLERVTMSFIPIGSIDDDEMFRTFNMGIGMAIIVDPLKVDDVKTVLSKLTPVFEIGKISSGNKDVVIA